MITIEQYLAEPCRALSIPYWKAKKIALPAGMKILHEQDFAPHLLNHFVDEPYFRLQHDLMSLQPTVLPQGYSFAEASEEEFAAHIRLCYYGSHMTAEHLLGYRAHPVYAPELWIAIRDDQTGNIAATGIGEIDREVGEGILEWIQVSPSHRGMGLGTCVVKELLQRMVGAAKFATVSGQCNNPTNPESLYRRCGFTGNDIWHILRSR